MKNIISIHPEDNVAVSIASIVVGGLVEFDSGNFFAKDEIPFGHKVAVKPIKQSEQIYKYGVPIGAASQDIEIGHHVHTHNMTSLYMTQFTKKG